MSDKNGGNLSQPGADQLADMEFVEAHSNPVSHGWHWLHGAFIIFTRKPGLWMGIMLIWFLITLLVSMVPVGSLILYVISPVLAGGILLASHEAYCDRPFDLVYLFKGFRLRNTDQLFIVGLIYLGLSLLAFIPCLLLGGALLFSFDENIDPSTLDPEMMGTMLIGVLLTLAIILPILMMYWFAPALVVFQQMKAWEAMKASFTGCLRNILPLTWYSLIVMVLMIVAVIPMGLGMLVLMPVLLISSYVSYRDVYTISPENK